VDGEATRSHDPAGVVAIGQAGADVVTAVRGVDEHDLGGAEAEIGPRRVVHEDLIAAP